MKRLIVTLTAGLAMLALGACGKQENKPQEGVTTDTTMQQQVPAAEEQKSVEEQRAEEQKPSAQAEQAEQYNGMAQADASADPEQDPNGQS